MVFPVPASTKLFVRESAQETCVAYASEVLIALSLYPRSHGMCNDVKESESHGMV